MSAPLQRSPATLLRENAFQIAMYLLGTALTGLLWPPLGVFYLLSSLGANYLYMAWICPYCGHYVLGTCAAGFDLLSGQRFQPRPGRTFGTEFRRRVWVLYPGWFLPPLASLFLLLSHFAWSILILLAVFCVVAFWLLPAAAQKHCVQCETADCPRYPKKRSLERTS